MTHVRVRLAPVLAALAGGEPRLDLDLEGGATVGDLLAFLGDGLPALARRVRDERGEVRRHVNVFVGPDNIRDRDGLATPLSDGVEVTILPAISGGG
ncbi:MAG: MoaD/ThiS family protein [Actinobacteria bacterium]|nr:MoaD/ThiS family protein [Actinomycetota bacterium]